nr:MAG TPA: hypothetical protein [Caudoviricetes sp.]
MNNLLFFLQVCKGYIWRLLAYAKKDRQKGRFICYCKLISLIKKN